MKKCVEEKYNQPVRIVDTSIPNNYQSMCRRGLIFCNNPIEGPHRATLNAALMNVDVVLVQMGAAVEEVIVNGFVHILLTQTVEDIAPHVCMDTVWNKLEEIQQPPIQRPPVVEFRLECSEVDLAIDHVEEPSDIDQPDSPSPDGAQVSASAADIPCITAVPRFDDGMTAHSSTDVVAEPPSKGRTHPKTQPPLKRKSIPPTNLDAHQGLPRDEFTELLKKHAVVIQGQLELQQQQAEAQRQQVKAQAEAQRQAREQAEAQDRKFDAMLKQGEARLKQGEAQLQQGATLVERQDKQVDQGRARLEQGDKQLQLSRRQNDQTDKVLEGVQEVHQGVRDVQQHLHNLGKTPSVHRCTHV